jgi:hypothetical protein
LHFAIERDGSWFVASANTFSGRVDGVNVFMSDESSGTTVTITLSKPNAEPAPTRLTNVDIINELINPASRVLTTVSAYASSVAVFGEAQIVDRPCWKTVITFDQNGPGAKFGPNGWTWCVDKQTGILLSFEDQTGDARRLTSVAFNQPDTSVPYPTVPPGTTIRVLPAEARPQPWTYQLSRPQTLDDVIADAKRQAASAP